MKRCKVCGHKVQEMSVQVIDSEHKLVEKVQVEARWMPYLCRDGKRHTV